MRIRVIKENGWGLNHAGGKIRFGEILHSEQVLLLDVKQLDVFDFVPGSSGVYDPPDWRTLKGKYTVMIAKRSKSSTIWINLVHPITHRNVHPNTLGFGTLGSEYKLYEIA